MVHPNIKPRNELEARETRRGAIAAHLECDELPGILAAAFVDFAEGSLAWEMVRKQQAAVTFMRLSKTAPSTKYERPDEGSKAEIQGRKGGADAPMRSNTL